MISRPSANIVHVGSKTRSLKAKLKENIGNTCIRLPDCNVSYYDWHNSGEDKGTLWPYCFMFMGFHQICVSFYTNTSGGYNTWMMEQTLNFLKVPNDIMISIFVRNSTILSSNSLIAWHFLIQTTSYSCVYLWKRL